MTMEDSKPEETRPKKQKKKNKANNANNTSNTNGKNEIPKPKAKKKNSKKNKAKIDKENEKDAKMLSTVGASSGVFALQEIANNKEASALIQDLVKCFTHNSTLPQEELDIYNKVLYEKTASVFTNILNNCVDKIFNKILNSGVLNVKKVLKKDASCQTDDLG